MKTTSTLVYAAAFLSAITLAEPVPQPDTAVNAVVEERANPTPSVLGTPKVVGDPCSYEHRLEQMKTCEKDGNWILLCQLYGDADKWMPHHNCPKGKVCSFAECKDAP